MSRWAERCLWAQSGGGRQAGGGGHAGGGQQVLPPRGILEKGVPSRERHMFNQKQSAKNQQTYREVLLDIAASKI